MSTIAAYCPTCGGVTSWSTDMSLGGDPYVGKYCTCLINKKIIKISKRHKRK